MRINSKSSKGVTNRRDFGSIVNVANGGLAKLSSGYHVNHMGNGSAVFVSQKSLGDSGGLPLVICSAGKRPVARVG